MNMGPKTPVGSIASWAKEALWADQSKTSFELNLAYDHFPFDVQTLDWLQLEGNKLSSYLAC